MRLSSWSVDTGLATWAYAPPGSVAGSAPLRRNPCTAAPCTPDGAVGAPRSSRGWASPASRRRCTARRCARPHGPGGALRRRRRPGAPPCPPVRAPVPGFCARIPDPRRPARWRGWPSPRGAPWPEPGTSWRARRRGNRRERRCPALPSTPRTRGHHSGSRCPRPRPGRGRCPSPAWS